MQLTDQAPVTRWFGLPATTTASPRYCPGLTYAVASASACRPVFEALAMTVVLAAAARGVDPAAATFGEAIPHDAHATTATRANPDILGAGA